MDLCAKLVAANVSLLDQCKSFLVDIPADVYTDATQPPFPFSIGAQVRHNLDMYACLIRDYEKKSIDFTNRERNSTIEVCPDLAIKHTERLQNDLKRFSSENEARHLGVLVEPATGTFLEIPMMLGGILGFLYYHTMHHHATIAVLSCGLNHTLRDGSFGYNPTTLRYIEGLQAVDAIQSGSYQNE